MAAAPSVFPTGTTIHDAQASWAGYTVLSVLRPGKVVVIDMEGRVVKEWEGFDNSAGGPARVLPNGDVIAAEGARPGHQESLALGQIIGQHQAHLIPKGLPGAGNVLVFDNGGASGYGAPSPIAPLGMNTLARATSRVLEIDPLTFRRVWAYAPPDGFFATNISGAQRLPNGNTLITEGPTGRVFEVTDLSRVSRAVRMALADPPHEVSQGSSGT